MYRSHYKFNHCNLVIVLARAALLAKQVLHDSFNMGTSGLPDMFTSSLGPVALVIIHVHVKHISCACVKTIKSILIL